MHLIFLSCVVHTPKQFILHDVIIPIFCQEYKLKACPIILCQHPIIPPIASFLIGPHIFLSTLFSKIHDLCSSFHVRDQGQTHTNQHIKLLFSIFNTSIRLSICLSIHLLTTYLPTHPPNHIPTYPPIYLHTYDIFQHVIIWYPNIHVLTFQQNNIFSSNIKINKLRKIKS
jgi:hypothetical protein